MRIPDQPQPPNPDHKVKVVAKLTGRTIFEPPTVWHVLCSCGAYSDPCKNETQTIRAAFSHLDFQLEDHQ